MGSTWVRRRGTSLSPRLLDIGVALAVAAAVAYRIWLADQENGAATGALAYGFGLVMTAALLPRRRWPVIVLAFETLAWVLYHSVVSWASGEPGPVLWVALYTAAAADKRRGLLPVAGALLLADIAGRVWQHGIPPLGSQFDASTVLWAVALLLGDMSRSRRLRLRQAESQREQEAQRRVALERLRIARELHDVLAHTITAITVQARVAEETIDRRPATARAALAAIRSASRDAMTELRATIGVVRQRRDGETGAGAVPPPAPGLDRLHELTRTATGGGLRVDVAVDGTARPLPAAVDLTAYRIVQESLANVVRHAGAATATVSVRYEPAGVRIEVTDDGCGASASPRNAEAGRDGEASRYGLLGMRERADALGGRFHAGPRAGGGFEVSAWLPTGTAAT
jgi:signal transduction histidine kinase